MPATAVSRARRLPARSQSRLVSLPACLRGARADLPQRRVSASPANDERLARKRCPRKAPPPLSRFAGRQGPRARAPDPARPARERGQKSQPCSNQTSSCKIRVNLGRRRFYGAERRQILQDAAKLLEPRRRHVWARPSKSKKHPPGASL